MTTSVFQPLTLRLTDSYYLHCKRGWIAEAQAPQDDNMECVIPQAVGARHPLKDHDCLLQVRLGHTIVDLAPALTRFLYREKLKVPANALDQLIEGAQGDIRQVLNMLSTWKLSSDTMDFDESRAMCVTRRSWLCISLTHHMLV